MEEIGKLQILERNIVSMKKIYSYNWTTNLDELVDDRVAAYYNYWRGLAEREKVEKLAIYALMKDETIGLKVKCILTLVTWEVIELDLNDFEIVPNF